MPTLAGHDLEALLAESRHSLVFRGRRHADGLPVIVKLLREEYPSPDQIAWLTREYALTRSLRAPGVVQAYSLERDGHRRLLVLEDFGGTSLAGLALAGSLDLGAFLTLAIQIAEALGQVHQQHVVHRDINPSNIVFNPATCQVKLIDFGIATLLPREQPTLRAPERLEGTLAYISPEQTGRMNRAMDYRTDYYSLGATFYELVTGQPPFVASNALALVHAHLAKVPLPPHQLRSDLPPAVGEIILKLLAKMAEERYQSTAGLIRDLQECLHRWEATATVTIFPLGRHDRPAQLEVSQRLYGREEACAQLLAAVDAAGQGRSSLFLVDGPAGIGKTALVRELYRPLAGTQGYLVSGKFDQLQRHLPYAALLQALRALVQVLLTEGEERLASLRTELHTALGPDGQVLCALLPEVEVVLGPQPAVPTLGPTEAQQRLHQVFARFLGVVGRATRPLVLFLDDLQWADHDSLELLQALLTAPACRHLSVIGAVRETEVGPLHPLQGLCDKLDEARVPVQRLTLAPLGAAHIQALLVDTLHCTTEQAAPLADLLLVKTEGNPFFLNEFLRTLYAQGLLSYDAAQGCWQWEIARIQAQGITDNVVELMAGRVRELPPATQDALTLAACIGHRFTLGVLALVGARVPQIVAQALWPALQAGLIVPCDEAYKVMDVAGDDLPEGRQVAFQFAHDRVQQAIYASIGEAGKPALHRRIGEALRDATPQLGHEEHIFAIVYQLNLGRALLTEQEERDELAALNLRAGQEARAAAAFNPAFHYLRSGLALLSEDSWTRQYALTLALHVAATEAGYICGQLDEIQGMCRAVVERARSMLDKVPVYDVMLQALVVRHNYREAVSTGLDILGMLGVQLPARPRTAHIVKALLATRLVLAGKRSEDLLNLPDMTDPLRLAVMRIMVVINAAAFSAAPLLVPLTMCLMVRLSVRYGNAPRSAAGYAGYGGLLCAGAGSIETGYRFGRLGVQLSERWNDNALHAITQLGFNALIWHWKQPLQESLAPMLDAYRAGVTAGAAGIAYQLLGLYALHAYLAGYNLVAFEREVEGHSAELTQLGLGSLAQRNLMYVQAARNLQYPSAHPCRIVGSAFDADHMLPLLREKNDNGRVATLLLLNLTLCVMFHEHTQALELAEALQELGGGTRGTVMPPTFYFYKALTQLAVYPSAAPADQRRYRNEVTAALRKLRTYADHAPVNYLHKWHLVAAERARVMAHEGEVDRHYQQAIRLASDAGYRNEEALAQELAGRFYLARDQVHLARFYLRGAHYSYTSWGALAKAADLVTRYPDLFSPLESTASSAIDAGTHTASSTASITLDLASVLQAAQAISSEIALDRLLSRLLHLALINAGAQRGVLFLEQAGELGIAADGESDQEAMVYRPLRALAGTSTLATTIVRYVARTKEWVTFPNAGQQALFAGDPYLAERPPRSLLCLPLLNQGKLIGLLYLENQLTADAFTANRLEVLQLLSSQAAVSLQNALLYEQLETYNRTLEQTVAQRTEELQAAMAQLERIATTDELTGVNNRRHLFTLGEVERAKAQRHGRALAAIMLDIDHFKQVNDRYGHGVGDQVLRVVAQRLRDRIRKGDILGRYGGEEFAIIVPETPTPGTLVLAERLRQKVADEPIPTTSGPLRCTISLGVAGMSEATSDLTTLLEHADQALYAAKQAGRNRVEVFPEGAPRECEGMGDAFAV